MNQHLKQAIAAARAGKNPQAKVLLARVIKDEPDNANAWFLLSTLADTEEQKVQHLQKVLELEPNHPAAAEQLAELVPTPPEPVEEFSPDFMSDTLEYVPETDNDGATNIYPRPEIIDTADVPEVEVPDVPDDPDEAMAWLERLAADQGANLDELPSLHEAAAEPEPTFAEFVEPEPEPVEAPDEPDEAMAWLEQLAADQGPDLDELPAMFEDEGSADFLADTDDDLSWLDDVDIEEEDSFESMPTLIDEVEIDEMEEADEEPERAMKVSDDFDFVSQSAGDSIPSWLVGEEDYIGADTVISGSVPEDATAEPAEPENLPDWLNDESLEDWVGEEGEKSGQVMWKAGEGEESLKPTPPPAEKKAATTAAAPRRKAAPKNDSDRILMGLYVLAFLLVVAILLVLVFQPL